MSLKDIQLLFPFFFFLDYAYPIFGLCYFLWLSTEAVAFFHSLSSALFSLLARLSRLIYWETLSARLSKLKERLWIWPTGLSTQLTHRVLGNLWRYLPIRNHDNRYFADWIRLCPGLSKNSENGNSRPKHKADYDWKQWEERSALRLRLLTAIWILSWRSSQLCRGKLILETRNGQESSRGIGMRLLALKTKQSILSLLAPAHSLGQGCCWKITLGSALQWDALASSPILQTLIKNYYTHTHTCTHFPSPHPSPPSLWTRQPDKRVCGQRRERLRVRTAACWSWITSPVAIVVCLWFMCFCWGVFSCSHTVLPKKHSLGVIFFLLSFLMLCCNFLQFPVFLSCLPPCHICMCMYGQVDG